jgi:MFS family permease
MKKDFGYFLVLVMLQGFVNSLLGYSLPVYFKQLGFSGIQTGIFFAIAMLAPLIFALPMGISTDRLTIPAILMGSFFLMALSRVGFLISTSFWVFCLFAFTGNLGGRFFGIAKDALFFKLSGKQNVREVGIFQLGQFIAMGLGMLLGGILIQGISFSLVFLVMLIFNLGLMVAAYFLPAPGTMVIALAEYKKAVLTPRVLLITFAFFLHGVHGGAEQVAYGPFLNQVLHLNTRQMGLYTAIGFMFVGLGAYGGSQILKRRWMTNVQTLLYLGFILNGVFHVMMCVPVWYWSFPFRLVHEVGDGLILLAYFHGIAQIFNLDKIGGCASFISLWTTIGSMLGSLGFGYIGDVWGPQWPLILSGVVMALTPLMLKILNRCVGTRDNLL